MTKERVGRIGLSSSTLHIIAMIIMLMDHSWATLFPQYMWLTAVGRLAFPIFAFMIAEGFMHTSNIWKYIGRMLLFGILAEVPFDYMVAGIPVYPYHQNVCFTFVIALVGLWLIDRALSTIGRGTGRFALGDVRTNILWRLWVYIQVALIVIITTLLGFLCFVDYYGVGVLTVYLFYFFRGRNLWCMLCQIVGMYILNFEMLGGYYIPVNVLGMELELVLQGLAILSLPIIWLYSGKRGITSRAFKYCCYAFYPAHCIILVLISILTKI